MKVRALLALVLVAGSLGVSAQRRETIVSNSFENDAVGQAPRGFLFGEARDAATNRWSVQREGSNQILVHAGDVVNGRGFATAVLARPELQEVDLSVRVKFLGGERTGGLVWRYRDPRNYYLVQLGLGDQSVGLYRIADGNRVRLETENDLELDPSAWHTLSVIQRDRSVRVYLGGIRVFEERDRTEGAMGTVGVWCGGNSVAQFDDLRVRRVDN